MARYRFAFPLDAIHLGHLDVLSVPSGLLGTIL